MSGAARVELCAERMNPARTSAIHGPSLFAHSIHMNTLHNLRVPCTTHFHTQDLHECFAQTAKPLHSPLPHRHDHSRLWRECWRSGKENNKGGESQAVDASHQLRSWALQGRCLICLRSAGRCRPRAFPRLHGHQMFLCILLDESWQLTSRGQ